MSYALTLGRLGVFTDGPAHVEKKCSCEEAWKGCAPSFVFSVPGQVQFRTALHHLIVCRKQRCRTLRSRVMDGMVVKLRWLMAEHSLLGCVHIQPSLYGRERPVIQRSDFPGVAHHLARCPKESCAQLRRALLLSIRGEVRPPQ